ncbi:DEKNAAC100460 [Brettanomyces naardenensis]|uniref:DEKNAAC100460 n=1 Tax=Brettanomyces naardenensis TaxID=13370 RepID=A0A448YEH4_BRENA|nr:DEKNAAC100460 [Brettanomyces naardenensis]
MFSLQSDNVPSGRADFVPMATSCSVGETLNSTSWLGDVQEGVPQMGSSSAATIQRNGSVTSSSSGSHYSSVSNDDDIMEFPEIFDYSEQPDSETSDISSKSSPEVAKSSILPPGSDAGLDFMTAFIKQEEEELPKVSTRAENNQPIRVMTPLRRERDDRDDRDEATINSKAELSYSESKNGSSSVSLARGGRIKKPLNPHQRKAHNKIERKYRININSKIANLQKLVPWMCDEGVAFEVEDEDDSSLVGDLRQKSRKLNKSMILDIVTKYIVHLKQENLVLRTKIRHYEGDPVAPH